MPLQEIRLKLSQLGGYDWVLKQLEKLPDTDIEGKARAGGKGRCAGAYELVKK